MFKKTLTYVDWNGEKITEDLYFNLNTVDQTRLLAKYSPSGVKSNGEEYTMSDYCAQLLKAQDKPGIIQVIEDIILSSYGVKSVDGRKFDKSKEVRESFEYSVAYAELFELLMTNQNEMNNFVDNIFQKKPEPKSSATAVVVS